jgi:phospholipid/cholesterol/gamma-HCH transport system permease protein
MGAGAFSLASDPPPPGVEVPAGAEWRTLRGRVTLAEAARLWAELRLTLRRHPHLCLDLSGVDRLDGGAAALLQALRAQQAVAGGQLEFHRAPSEVADLLERYACDGVDHCVRQAPREPGLLTDIGNFAVLALANTRSILGFLGDLVHGLWRAVLAPRTVHFGDFGRLLERAGADGVPIIALILFLVGAVLGLQGAMQLHRFGGDAFLASLVGLSVVREFGPLLTAILITGRSGAGYAAELGTMAVNEEIDALRTLGQDPQRFLVFPRVLALVAVVPLLTLLADLAGIVGGWLVALWYLEQPSVVYVQTLKAAVRLGDVGTGLLKSLAFAAAIGLVACQRGLATRGGAEGVGNATTSAVVTSLFTLVVIDAVLTNVFSLLGW